MADRLSVIVAGGMASVPFAGTAWQGLGYLEGLRRLGHRVFYLEDTGSWPYDPARDTVSADPSAALGYLASLLDRVALGRDWAYRDPVTGRIHGAGEARLRTRLDEADAILNISGMAVLRQEHLRVPVRIFLDTDPVLAQIEVAKGKRETVEWLAAHTHHFTWGENLGTSDCDVPSGGFAFLPTRQPVVLDWWHPARDDIAVRRAFTTVANWKQTDKDIEWKGELWTWSKDVEFLRYIDLPRRVARPLELALSSVDEASAKRLERAGWSVVPALQMTKDPDAYRGYVQSSAGEFSIAKAQYVRSHSGWFSDRTAAYLAAGKPAIVQDTGFRLPRGEGLFGFKTLDDVLAAFEAIDSDYGRHSRAALDLAAEHLRAETVIGRLLADAGLT